MVMKLLKKFHPLWVMAGLALYGCSKIIPPEETDGFGLTKVEVTITSENLGRLNSNVFLRLQVPARLEIDGRKWAVKVRYSGQTSINHTKKSFAFEFPDDSRFNDHRFYGLSAANGDPTGLNPIVGFHAFAQAGLQTPTVEPATLYLNGEYKGLYFLIEPIDEDFFKKRGQRLGALYEAARSLAHFSFAGGYDVRLGFDNNGERPDYFGDLEELITVLDESAASELPAKLEPLLDVESYLSYLAVAVLFHNFDGYFNNFRMHRNAPSDKFTFIPWDVDRLFEIHARHSTIRGANELSEKLLAVPAYRQRYREILIELMDDKLAPAKLDELLDQTASKISEAFAADRILAAPGILPLEYAARRKSSLREWFEKIRGDLATLD
jgi:spore coat protein H